MVSAIDDLSVRRSHFDYYVLLAPRDTAGLTDYEIRDLNDEINKLMREKSHYERQIIALGGANYRRARTSMLDEEGREVPGTRGYKSVITVIAQALALSKPGLHSRYFGRAKDLPGVKELFQRGAVAETEDAARFSSFQKFRDQGPEYYGDLDEVDPELVKEEEEMEIEGTFRALMVDIPVANAARDLRLGYCVRKNSRAAFSPRRCYATTSPQKGTCSYNEIGRRCRDG